jgi:hypothetical protein
VNTLANTPILKIVADVNQVACRFLNPNDALRKEAESALTQASSKEMAQFILDDCFSQLTESALIQLLEEELGDPLVLDCFRPKRKGFGRTRAYGPQTITHILPCNIPSIPIISLVLALLVKSASIAKISERDAVPSLTALFVKGLQSVNETLSQSVTLIQTAATAEAFDRSDLVILYGTDQTIATLRPLIPQGTRVIVHGPKVSLGIVARDEITRQVAESAALDVALYDQAGCLSPHLYYVEEGGKETPLVFAQSVAEALAKIPLPKGKATADQASAILQLRGTLPLKGGTVFASKGTDWTVLYDPNPEFTPSPLSRTVFIKPIKTLSDIGEYLSPIARYLQAVGIAVSSVQTERLINQLGLLGVCRICPIGKMQKPPLTWHHDARFRLLDLLQFTDWEEGETLQNPQ